jgi:hypothetical protein
MARLAGQGAARSAPFDSTRRAAYIPAMRRQQIGERAGAPTTPEALVALDTAEPIGGSGETLPLGS